MGNLPGIWMPYWSEPAKRDNQSMDRAREALRTRDLPYIERSLGEPGGGRQLVRRILDGRRADDGARDGAGS